MEAKGGGKLAKSAVVTPSKLVRKSSKAAASADAADAAAAAQSLLLKQKRELADIDYVIVHTSLRIHLFLLTFCLLRNLVALSRG